jgi:uncharacterized protein YukE
VADFSVDTGDLAALSQAFAAAGSDVRGIAASFRSGAGRLTSGDALGRPDVVTQYTQAFDQWTHNLDEIAASMEKLSHALRLARNLYEIAERKATVDSR